MKDLLAALLFLLACVIALIIGKYFGPAFGWGSWCSLMALVGLIQSIIFK